MWNTFAEWNSGYYLRRLCTLKTSRVHNVMGSNYFDLRANLAWKKLPAKWRKNTYIVTAKYARNSDYRIYILTILFLLLNHVRRKVIS